MNKRQSRIICLEYVIYGILLKNKELKNGNGFCAQIN